MRERRKYLLLMGAIAAALVGAVLLAVPGSPVYKKPTLGLDLQGGLEVVLRAVPDEGPDASTRRRCRPRSSIIAAAASTSIGVASPNIAIQGGERDRDPARRRPRPGEGRAR